MKTCRICLKKFTPPSGSGQGHACFCGDKCREVGKQESKKATYKQFLARHGKEGMRKKAALQRDQRDSLRKLKGVGTCAVCKEVKPANEFSRGQKNCKSCASTSWKKYYSSHKEKLGRRKRKKSFRKRTPEQKEAYIKEKKYVKELHSLQKQGKRRCRICKTVKILDDFPNDSSSKVHYNKKSYCNHCYLVEYQRPYQKTQAYKNNKRKSDHKYLTRRRKEDPLFRFSLNIRALTRNSLSSKGFSKEGTLTTEILGCTVPESREHIEKQFKEGMTWENHGAWEIDHIVPVSMGENREEIILLSHHSNLQPLWRKENAEKFNKLIPHMISPENKIRYKEILARNETL